MFLQSKDRLLIPFLEGKELPMTALLSYNLHTMQFTHFYCTTQWFLGNSQNDHNQF